MHSLPLLPCTYQVCLPLLYLHPVCLCLCVVCFAFLIVTHCSPFQHFDFGFHDQCLLAINLGRGRARCGSVRFSILFNSYIHHHLFFFPYPLKQGCARFTHCIQFRLQGTTLTTQFVLGLSVGNEMDFPGTIQVWLLPLVPLAMSCHDMNRMEVPGFGCLTVPVRGAETGG